MVGFPQFLIIFAVQTKIAGKRENKRSAACP